MNTVIFDIDGTLTDNNHRLHLIRGDVRNWVEYTAECVNDSPRKDIIKIYQDYQQKGFDMVLMSGRSESVKKETIQWLTRNGVEGYRLLLMRPVNCYEKDSDLKRQWLEQEDLCDAEVAYDDLPHNINMFEACGIRTVLI